MSEETKKYDKEGNLCVHGRDPDGFEYWHKYDRNGNEIYFKNSDGYEYWRKYNNYNREIYSRYADGDEVWFDGEGVPITEQEFEQIQRAEEVTRFELMELFEVIR